MRTWLFEMASSEVLIKGNCVNGKVESYSSGHNDAKNIIEGQNAHSSSVTDAEAVLHRDILGRW